MRGGRMSNLQELVGATIAAVDDMHQGYGFTMKLRTVA
jgi:hypothetical protein